MLESVVTDAGREPVHGMVGLLFPGKKKRWIVEVIFLMASCFAR
jgi:hypothetical protein